MWKPGSKGWTEMGLVSMSLKRERASSHSNTKLSLHKHINRVTMIRATVTKWHWGKN